MVFNELEKINYIKCDVEGYDMIVLSGMKEIIEKHKPIVQAEIWGANKSDLYSFFSKIGYKPMMLQNNKLTVDNDSNKSKGGDRLFMHKSIVPLYI